MERKIKKEKGITLIALVITIIVLLILAGVAVATLTGENGILNKATTAALETDLSRNRRGSKSSIYIKINGRHKFKRCVNGRCSKPITNRRI